MKTRQLDIAVYVSAAVLAVSVFLPVTSFAIIGDVSYNRIAEVESYIVIAFCASAAGLLIADMSKFVAGSAAGVWITLLFPAIQNAFKSDDGGLLSRASKEASGRMQEFAADLFLHITDFSWGGFVLLLALLAFTAACVMRSLK